MSSIWIDEWRRRREPPAEKGPLTRQLEREQTAAAQRASELIREFWERLDRDGEQAAIMWILELSSLQAGQDWAAGRAREAVLAELRRRMNRLLDLDWSGPAAAPELRPGKDGHPGWGDDYGPLGGAGPRGEPVRKEGKEGWGDDYAPLGAAGESEEPGSGQDDYGDDYMPLGGAEAGAGEASGEGDEGMPDPDGGGGGGRRLPAGVRIRRGWAAYDPEGGGGEEGGPSGLRNPRGPRSLDPEGDWSLRPTSHRGGATVRPRRPGGPAVRTPNPDDDEGPIGPAFRPDQSSVAGWSLAGRAGR